MLWIVGSLPAEDVGYILNLVFPVKDDFVEMIAVSVADEDVNPLILNFPRIYAAVRKRRLLVGFSSMRRGTSLKPVIENQEIFPGFNRPTRVTEVPDHSLAFTEIITAQAFLLAESRLRMLTFR